MSAVADHPIITLWTAWIAILPLGPWLSFRMRRKWNCWSTAIRRAFVFVCISSVSFACVTLFTRYSFHGFWPDAVHLAFAYFAVWVIVTVPFAHASHTGKFLRIVIAVPSFLLGIAVYTFLGFGIAMDQLIPREVVEVRPRIEARIHQYGFAGNDTDIVEIVRRFRWMAVLEETVVVYATSSEICAQGAYRITAQPQDAIRVQCTSPLRTAKTYVVR